MSSVNYPESMESDSPMVKITFLFALIVALQAAGGASLPPTRVFDDVRMICVCVIGATIGAFLAVAAFPMVAGSDSAKTRALAMKFGSSLLAGIAFTPGLMHWFELDLNAEYLMATSAGVAVFSVSALHVIAPKVERVIDVIFESRKGGRN